MNEKQAEAFLNWAHQITANVESLLSGDGQEANADVLRQQMTTLGEVTLEQSLEPPEIK